MNNLKPIQADVKKLVELRERLSLTPAEVSQGVGLNEMQISKIESAMPVRPKALLGVLQFYHNRLEIADWKLDDFVDSGHSQSEINDADLCPNCKLLRDYFKTVYCHRQPETIDQFCSQEIRFTGEGR